MTLNELINYKLIDSEKFDISVLSILMIFVIILATYFILKLIKKIINRLTEKKKLDSGTVHSIFLIIKYFIWVIIIILCLDSIGIEISILMASAAALLVGVGLGLQQLFNDIASGIVLLFEGSIKLNDVIELDDETVGKVILLGIRTSKLKTRDDVIIIVPNSKLVNDNIINWSHMDKKTRFHVNIGVAYGSDVKLVEKILLKCATSNKDIYDKPAPFVRFLDFGESSLDFQLFFWVRNTFTVENLKSDLRFEIDQQFRSNKVEIPFPQRDVHLKNNT